MICHFIIASLAEPNLLLKSLIQFLLFPLILYLFYIPFLFLAIPKRYFLILQFCLLIYFLFLLIFQLFFPLFYYILHKFIISNNFVYSLIQSNRLLRSILYLFFDIVIQQNLSDLIDLFIQFWPIYPNLHNPNPIHLLQKLLNIVIIKQSLSVFRNPINEK